MTRSTVTRTKTQNTSTRRVEGAFIPRPDRTIEWFGGVDYENLEKVLGALKLMLTLDAREEIHLMVNSYGGVTGIGMSFYDAIKTMYRPNLVTIGSGDVDSSGVVVFLSGKKRYITKNTTLLLHLAGRTFDKDKRYTVRDMEYMLKEDKLKDYQYACVLSDATDGKCTPERILEMMSQDTILTAEEAVNLGFAHKVL